MTEQYQDERLDEMMQEFMSASVSEVPFGKSKKVPRQDNGDQEIYERHELQNERIEGLRTQVQNLHKEIRSQLDSNNQHKNSNALEISSLQEKYITHANKLEYLENKQQLLKADVETQSEKKNSGFGSWGWVFLTSNVLLWSVLGWFVWGQSVGEFNNIDLSETSIASIDEYQGLDEVIDN